MGVAETVEQFSKDEIKRQEVGVAHLEWVGQDVHIVQVVGGAGYIVGKIKWWVVLELIKRVIRLGKGWGWRLRGGWSWATNYICAYSSLQAIYSIFKTENEMVEDLKLIINVSLH